MRSRAPLFITLLMVGVFVLPHFAHASIPFFGPIIDTSFNRCAAGWKAVIIVVNHTIELLITIAIVFVAPLTLSYAGFKLVVSQGDPGKITEARHVATNTVVGIVIALSAWMIVDAIMAALYNPDALIGETKLGVWSDLIKGTGSFCLIEEGAFQKLNQSTSVQGVTASGEVTTPSGLKFTSEASAQIPNESGALAAMLSCLGGQLKTGATVTSISDHVITDGTHTIQECAAKGKTIGCSHTANSCHYGGRNCAGSSYAADVSGDSNDLTSAAQSCSASSLDEGNHVHISVGSQNNCGCDSGLE